MILTRDFITCENHCQITSLMTKKSLFTVTHALFFISFTKMRLKLVAILSWPQCVSRNLSPITASNQQCLCQCCVYLVRSHITELS